MRGPANRGEQTGASHRDLLVGFLCGGMVAAMIGASFAAVPFYSWFCRTTGYGGTTQVSKAAPAQISDRTITVRFLPTTTLPATATLSIRQVIPSVSTPLNVVVNGNK